MRPPRSSAATPTAPDVPAPTGEAAAPPPNPDPDLLAVLKGIRTEMASERRVPPYIVFADRSLNEMAAARPLDEAAMSRIHGVGPAKQVFDVPPEIVQQAYVRGEPRDEFWAKVGSA